MNEKPKVRRGWFDHRVDRAESSLLYVVEGWADDHAGATWRMRDGRVFWTACMPDGGPEPWSEIDQGICDTIEQAQAAAEAALRAAGYELEETTE